MPKTIAYVLTSNGDDVYADMTLLSALSVRFHEPDARIAIVCDKDSAIGIKSQRHKVTEVVDNITEVKTPDENATFKNRWIKTQLPNFLPGDVLFLDSDTIVRRKLDIEKTFDTDFAAVANHNGANLKEQLWDEDEAVLRQMNWFTNFAHYVNGGFWFYRRTSHTCDFFREWHIRWLKSYRQTSRLRDQPALNSALDHTKISVTILPRCFNEQIAKSGLSFTKNAAVWHFYSSTAISGTGYHKLLTKTRRMSIRRTATAVKRFSSSNAPWCNQDPLARWLDKTCIPQNLSQFQKLWLDGQRFHAITSFTRSLVYRLYSKLR